VRRQAELVRGLVEAGGSGPDPVQVTPVLCFVGSQWAMPASQAGVGSVLVARLGGLGRIVGRIERTRNYSEALTVQTGPGRRGG